MKKLLSVLLACLLISPSANSIGVDGGSGSVQTVGTINCSGGKVNVDSGTLYVDCANNRVGAGTTAPNKALQVSGSGPSLQITDSASGTGDGDGTILQHATNDLYIYNREAGFMDFATANTSRMVIGSDGNVGINDATPDAQFELVSVSSATGFVVAISSQNGVTGNLFAINGNGNIGMGTVTPTSRLQLNGDAIYLHITDQDNGIASTDGTVFQQANADHYIYNKESGFLDLGTANASRLLIASDGKVSIVSAGFAPYSRTKAQIDALDPVAAGEVVFCSNCATSGDVCVSTGAAVAQYRRVGTAAGCGSNE